MALSNAYILPLSRLPDLFNKIRDAQAPPQVTQQLLKDWGFKSTNDRAFIPLLKAIGFLTPDGKPTQRYLDYRNHSESKRVLGQGLREAYNDIFLIKEKPTEADRVAIEGKFKSFHNASDNVAGLMAKTFLALLPLADLAENGANPKSASPPSNLDAEKEKPVDHRHSIAAGLHYNIQIHLPATKDIEVYNAIFKSIRDHLYGK